MMQVQTSQLREGYVLLKDVQGKSGRPIMKKNTVLTNKHIVVLQKFLIDSVAVTTRQVNDSVYLPTKEIQKRELPRKKSLENKHTETEKKTYKEHYLQVVSSFKKEFQQWNSGVPINISQVRNFIIPLLERTKELDLEAFILQDFVEAKEYIYHHAVAVSVVAAFIGNELKLSKGECLQVGLAGLLCDVGMTRVDESILTKVGPLTEKQLKDIKNHPVYSSRMVEDLPALAPAAKVAIIQHHERMDGSGYPLGLAGDKINQYARILAVSDTYHAMASERLYKAKQPLFKVVDEIKKDQFSRLDAKVVHTFINSLTLRSLGKSARLSDGRTGEIVFIDENNPTKPLIKLEGTKEIINLQEHPQLYVEEIILED